jgi:hypothetical protein
LRYHRPSRTSTLSPTPTEQNGSNLWASSGNLWASSGNLWPSSGNLWPSSDNLWPTSGRPYHCCELTTITRAVWHAHSQILIHYTASASIEPSSTNIILEYHPRISSSNIILEYHPREDHAHEGRRQNKSTQNTGITWHPQFSGSCYATALHRPSCHCSLLQIPAWSLTSPRCLLPALKINPALRKTREPCTQMGGKNAHSQSLQLVSSGLPGSTKKLLSARLELATFGSRDC